MEKNEKIQTQSSTLNHGLINKLYYIEQFENFEIMRRQSKSKSITNSSLKQTTISTPKKVAEMDSEVKQTEIPKKSIPKKVIEMEVEEKQTEISKNNSTPSRF